MTLAIISENSTDHALLVLAAMSVGIPVAPISVAYATLANDFSRLRHMIELIQPGAIFIAHPQHCAAAANAIGADGEQSRRSKERVWMS